MEELIDASAWVLPVVIAITLHEAAHGWMAERYGDDTARIRGRVSFNPLRHVDLYGTIIIPGLLMLAHAPFLFGYAKPVPVDFRRLNPPRLGMLMVALAGPGINLLIALMAGIALHIDTFVTPEEAQWVFLNLYRMIMLNCVIAVFNMLPILPLDGGRVLFALLSGKAQEIFGRTERFGIVLVLAFLLIPGLLGWNIAQQAIGVPTYWLVEQVLWLTGNGEA